MDALRNCPTSMCPVKQPLVRIIDPMTIPPLPRRGEGFNLPDHGEIGCCKAVDEELRKVERQGEDARLRNLSQMQ